jgi:hypothetical protein
VAGFLDGGPLNVRIRVAFGALLANDPSTWPWVDVTPWWHPADDVQIEWGRSSGAEQAETSTLQLTLKNTDGRFTAFDPRSPYWPDVVTWTPISYDVDLGDGQGWRNRFSGYVRSWPMEWPAGSSKQVLARITAVGVWGRLGRGKPPTQSAMRRAVLASQPNAYWPFEDGGDSSQAASALPGQAPATITGTVVFEEVSDPYFASNGQPASFSTEPLANLNQGGGFRVQLPAAATTATSAGQWSVQCASEVNVTAAGDVVLMEWATPGGTYVRWRLTLVWATSTTRVTGYTADGTAVVLINGDGIIVSFSIRRVSAQQTGSNLTVSLYADFDVPAATVTVAGTLAGITAISGNGTGASDALNRMVYGHLAVWATAKPAYALGGVVDGFGIYVWDPARGHEKEFAHLRLGRVAAEEGLPIEVPAAPADQIAMTRMTRQPVASTIDLIQQCETTDQGLVYESGFGLGYLPRYARLNPAVALVIDGALGHIMMPFRPAPDDQTLRNRWTSTRQGGSSAVVVDQDSVDRQGPLDGSTTVYAASDDVLPADASWRLRQASVPEARYPEASIDVGTHRELADDWVGCRPGSRVQIVNPPRQILGPIDQLVVGSRETFSGRRGWKATLNLIPVSPWFVGVYGASRYDSASTVTHAAYASTTTTIRFRTADPNDLWDTTATPYPVICGGEVWTVTSMGAATGTAPNLIQQATVIRSANGVVKEQRIETPIHVLNPGRLAL